MRRDVAFSGVLDFCSNFYYPCPVYLYGLEYASVEHSYQAAKFLDPAIREQFRVVGMTPGQAKKLAKKLTKEGHLWPLWLTVNINIMEELVRQKFRNIFLLGKLVGTGWMVLEETNYWHDNFWGICLCEKCAKKQKYNYLGKILMMIREETQGGMPIVRVLPERVPTIVDIAPVFGG